MGMSENENTYLHDPPVLSEKNCQSKNYAIYLNKRYNEYNENISIHFAWFLYLHLTLYGTLYLILQFKINLGISARVGLIPLKKINLNVFLSRLSISIMEVLMIKESNNLIG